MENDSDPTLADVIELIRSRFDAIDARFDLVEERLANHSESLAWLKMHIGMLSQALAGVSAGVEHCKLGLAQRDGRVDRLETTVARMVEVVDLPEEPNS